MSVDVVMRALADPTRRAVFEQVCRGETTVTALTEKFDVSQPAISQHLAALRAGGLVKVRRAGRSAFYRVDPKGLRPLVTWIERYQVFWRERLASLETLLEEIP
jgi:DNA-binding transcriptional ArsR family regulator